MKKVILLVLVGALIVGTLTAFSGCSDYSAEIKEGNPEKKTSLTVHDDGSFRILQITDMHLVSKGKTKRDKQSMQWLEEAIEIAKPDLIEMTGDVTGGNCKGRNDGILAVANLLEEKQVYWAYTFGNHDGEHAANAKGKSYWAGKEGPQTDITEVCSGAKGYDKSLGKLFYGDNSKGNEEIFELLKGYEYCLTARAPEEKENQDTMGVGNYVIDLKNNNGDTVFALIHMDSHGKIYFEPAGNTDGPDGYSDVGYAGLTDKQVEWYRNTVSAYSKAGIKTALFMHVPNFGFREITEDYNGTNERGIPQFSEKEDVENKVSCFKDTGFLMDEDGIYGPRFDEGLEVVMDEFPSTNLIATGHDHNNCFFLRKDISDKYKNEEEKKNEIILAYGRTSGVNAWGRTVDIGATIYDVNTNGSTIDDIYEIKEIYPSFEYLPWKE